MATKEQIQAEIEALGDEHLDELYTLVKNFTRSKRHARKRSFMSSLKEVQIDGPEDFAANLDLYVSGEKSAESNLH